jgi:FlaA1/EpsC-like NDP-sugar epimerase
MGVNEFAFYAIKNVASRGPLLRFGTQFAIDAAAWTVALIAAVMLRYDFQLELVGWRSLAVICAVTIVVQFATGWIFYLYRGRHPYGSFAEVLALTFTVLVTGAIVGLPLLLVGVLVEVPRSTMIIGLPIAFVLMGAVRYIKRVIVESARRPSGDVERALIYGAGYLGSTIVRRMVTDSNATLSPVGMIDDNPSKRHVRFDGVRVLGARKDLAAAVEATGATVLVVAIAKTDAGFLRDTSDAARALGLQIKVLPPFEEVLEGKSRLKDLRDVSIEDLIGRHPVDTEVESIASYITGRRVLVTGAGGSRSSHPAS